MASVKVFGSPASTEVQRVLACLFEKQVDFQLVKMDNFRGDRRMPECLKMQPGGEALTYQDQDKDALVESRAICRHVVDKFKKQGNRELLGEGALERALIEQWLETEAQKFDPPTSELVFYLSIVPSLPENLRVEIPALDENKKKLEKVLKVYDQRLADNTFLAGNKFTLADLSHLPNTALLMKEKTTQEIFSKHANVNRWWGQISQRESWKKVLEISEQVPPKA